VRQHVVRPAAGAFGKLPSTRYPNRSFPIHAPGQPLAAIDADAHAKMGTTSDPHMHPDECRIDAAMVNRQARSGPDRRDVSDAPEDERHFHGCEGGRISLGNAPFPAHVRTMASLPAPALLSSVSGRPL